MFHNVIIGIDGSAGGRDALALARQLAAPGAQLTMVHVYASGIPVVPSILTWDEVEKGRATELLEREREATRTPAEIVTVGSMTAGEGLHRVAERRHADLLVVGSSHRGIAGRVLVGDDTRQSLNGAPCAVAVAPTGHAAASGRFVRVGVGYDASAESAVALDVAREIAVRDGAELEALDAVHVPAALPPTPAIWMSIQPDVLEHSRKVMAQLEGVQGSALVGDPRHELVGLSRRVDLLVVGSRGYGPWRRMLFGSTSSYLQRHVRCPLLVMPRGADRRDDSPPADGHPAWVPVAAQDAP